MISILINILVITATLIVLVMALKEAYDWGYKMGMIELYRQFNRLIPRSEAELESFSNVLKDADFDLSKVAINREKNNG